MLQEMTPKLASPDLTHPNKYHAAGKYWPRRYDRGTTATTPWHWRSFEQRGKKPMISDLISGAMYSGLFLAFVPTPTS